MKNNISNLRHDPNDPKIKEIRDIIIQVDHFKKTKILLISCKGL